MEKEESTTPDINSRNQRIADLQSTLDILSSNLFFREQNSNLYNYQFTGECICRLIEIINPELTKDEKEKAERNWNNLSEIIDLPIFDVQHSHSFSGSKQSSKPNLENRKKIRKEIYKSRIFFNSLSNKYGWEGFKQTPHKTKED